MTDEFYDYREDDDYFNFLVERQEQEAAEVEAGDFGSNDDDPDCDIRNW